jgi:hypothetical protein
MNAEKIFGPDLGSLKGKTTRSGGEHVKTVITDINNEIMDRYRHITLTGDIMFVNKVPFFMTVSRAIKFGTAEMIADRKNHTIVVAIKQVIAAYSKRGFVITHLLMDGEFEPIRSDLALLGVNLNVASSNEHVPEIERHIRTVKERVRCVYNTLPFKTLPDRLIIELVYYATFWLNSFPPNDGISKKDCPRVIITGIRIDYNKHCQLEFGSYAQVHEDHDNTMSSRTTGVLVLRPTGNSQGGYFFYSLTTGRVLNRNS